MTIDEAIKHAEEVAESKEKQIKNGDWEKDSLTERNCIKCAEEHRQLVEWLRDYKRLKEQEPSEDAISRDAVEEIINDIRDCISVEGYWAILERMKKLPSVKPQEPKTVLYSGDGYTDGYMVYDMAECPNCGYEYDYGDKDWGLPFCPNCGQKLNWERSDKE